MYRAAATETGKWHLAYTHAWQCLCVGQCIGNIKRRYWLLTYDCIFWYML